MAVDSNQVPNNHEFGNSKRLSVKLVVETILFSLFISIIVSTIQIYSNYQTSMAAAEGRYSEIEAGFLPSLSAGLWEVNIQRVDALLDSIAQLPNVGRIYLIDEEKNIFMRNSDISNAFSQREMALHYSENGSSFNVGLLGIELNNDALWAQLKKQAVQTATITSLTLFASALFILFLFQQRVSRHLHTMAVFAKDFDVHQLGLPLTLHRKPHSQPDELDIVVGAINEMQSELQHELELRSNVEQSLRSHQENLENLVKERTLELKSSAEQLAIAVDVAKLGVWQWNLLDDSLHWNNQMFQIFALPTTLLNTGLNYQHWYNRIHPDDVLETAASLTAEVEGRGNMRSVYRLLLPKKEIRYVQAAVKIERDEEGIALRVIGINIDITQRMEIENSLRSAKEQADAANAAKSSFLANMSHEIRTPLNAVLGILQLLQKTKLTLRQADYVIKSQNAALSLLNLLSDILDLSKADAGKLQLENNPFDLESLLQDLAVAVSGSRKNPDVELIFDISPTLPRSLIGDKFRLQQVLINLTGNALKFTMTGHVRVLIEQTLQTENEVRMTFSVFDTGIGINAQHIEQIFDEFIQAESSTTRRFGGTGLGLVISKHIVQRMGGELKVTSELGVGSHFWFEILLKLEDAEKTTELELCPTTAPLRILVVDDKAISRNILKRTLSHVTPLIDEAESTHQALEHIRQAEAENQAYDVVIIDSHIQSLQDTNLAELINAEPDIFNIPKVILLCAYGSENNLASHLESSTNYVEVLFKPVTPRQLMTSISDAKQKVQQAEPQSLQILHGVLAGIKLLVVDDNEINRLIAYELLKHEGAEVELAEGGLDAVNLILTTNQIFDVVLMDIQMPDIDGFEATQRIRKDQRFTSLPILALTANVSQQDIDDCLAAGMNGHIGKPFEMSNVVSNILSCLAQV
jgi:signal transduction histidine kinase/CheY-like chemotaxis protein